MSAPIKRIQNRTCESNVPDARTFQQGIKSNQNLNVEDDLCAGIVKSAIKLDLNHKISADIKT